MGTGADPTLDRIFQAIFLGVLVIVVAGDLLLLAAWSIGQARGRSLLAPRWGLGDLFLAGQVVVVALIGFGIPLMFLVFLFNFRSGARQLTDLPPAAMFYGFFLPFMLAQQVALAGVPAWYVLRKYQGSLQDLGLPWPQPRPVVARRLAAGAVVALALIPGADFLETISRRWIESGAAPHAEALKKLAEQTNALAFLEQIRHDPAAVALMVLVVGIIGPIAEEVFFRGFAYRAFRLRFGVPAGVLASAVLFSVAHMNPVGLLPIFLIGVILAWLYERTGSLIAPIGMHCANNLLALLFYFLAPDFSFWDRLLPR